MRECRFSGLLVMGCLVGCAPALRAPEATTHDVAEAVAAPAAPRRQLHAAVAVSGDDVIAVGAAGLLIRFDGAQWHTLSTGTTETLRGVWASAIDDVWAVGDHGTLLHGDRVRMQPIAVVSNDLFTVAGASADDVWITGAGGALLHFDGARLTSISTGTAADLRAIAVLGHDDVRIVGSAGTVLRYDGTRWSRERTGTSAELRALFARGPNDVWAVGDARLHWDGQVWSPVPGPCGLVDVTGDAESVWALAANGAVSRWDGSTWMRAARTDAAAQGVWVARAGKGALVGLGSTLVRSPS